MQKALAAASDAAVTVQLAGGTYRLAETWRFSAADSGTAAHPVRWIAAPGARPVISGATKVTGWQAVASAPGVYSAAVEAGTRSRQLYVDGAEATVAEQNVTQLGFAGGWSGSSTGYSLGADTKAKAWFGALSASQAAALEFEYQAGNGRWTDTRCGVASASATAIVMDQPCWRDATNRASFSKASGGLPSMSTSTLPSRIANAFSLIKPGHWFLDTAANKLYYRPTQGQPSMSALDIELPRLESLVTVAGSLAEPVHDISFSGLQFSYATWNAPSDPTGFADVQSNLHITGSNNQGMCTFSSPDGTCPWGAITQPKANIQLSAADRISLVGNRFSELGGAGLNIVYGSADNLVQGNEFTDIASTAVLLGCTFDPTPQSTPASVIEKNCTPNAAELSGDSVGSNEIITGNTVSNNLVHDVGTDYLSASAITLLFSQHTAVSHNDIFNVPYTAITAGVINGHVDNVDHPQESTNINDHNTISANLIHNMMEALHDGGAIYVEGHQAQYVTNSDGSVNEAATEAAALQAVGNVAYAGNDNNTYYDDAGSEWINWQGNVAFDELALGSSNNGCQPTGHFWITDNYFSARYGAPYGCYTAPTDATDIHTSGNTTIPQLAGPGDVPTSVLSAAGLTATYRSMETALGASAYYISPARTSGSSSSVLIGGVGFTPATSVQFGTTSAQVQFLSQGFLIATVPTGTAVSSISIGKAPLSRFDDTSPYISYTGTWSTSSKRNLGDFDDNVHSTKVNGDSATLRFTGTGVSVFSELNTDQGDVSVSVDGGTATNIDTGAANGIRQSAVAIFGRSGLAPGAHTIVVTKKSGTYMTLDGFSVQNDAD